VTPVPLPVGHEPSLVFPPVLARVARERLAPLSACLAGVAVFLCSRASDFVTGSAIPVDGGYSAQG